MWFTSIIHHDFLGKRLRLVYMHGCCLPWWIEPFKSAAVQSQEFQICAFSRQYKLFLNLNTEGNIDSVILLPIKPCKRWLCLSEGKKRSWRSHIDILFCCFVWLTKKKDKYVYDQSSDFHLTAVSLHVTPNICMFVFPRIKLQT